MASSRINNLTMSIPDGSILDAMIDPATNIDADKLQHVHKPGTNFDLAIAATPAAREEIVFVAGTAGTIRGFYALLNVTGSSTDVDFDLKVNGSSVLTAAINLTDATADKAVVEGTLSSVTLAADDVVSISLAVTSSTGAQGPFAWVDIEELAA